jgi:type VI secretion system secreted protein Hcp
VHALHVSDRWFLKIDGIEGDSASVQHKGEIDVESWSFGVTQTGSSSTGGGGGAGKASFQDFHFVSRISKASPALFLACATGQHQKSATLSGERAGRAKGGTFLQYKLNDVLVTSVQQSDSAGGEVPVEQYSLNYSKIELSFFPQDAKGKVGSPITAGFDVKAQKKA